MKLLVFAEVGFRLRVLQLVEDTLGYIRYATRKSREDERTWNEDYLLIYFAVLRQSKASLKRTKQMVKNPTRLTYN